MAFFLLENVWSLILSNNIVNRLKHIMHLIHVFFQARIFFLTKEFIFPSFVWLFVFVHQNKEEL